MNQRIPPQMQRMNSTPTPIRIGVIFIFPVVVVEETGMGLAGTLPAYSAGAGGGGVAGRGTDGTADATRGEATVAAGSKLEASNTSTICSPNETTSPAFRTRGPANRCP